MGLSMTAIGKILHYHTSTIMRWVRKYAKAGCRKPEPKGEIVVELDEMWHYIKSKKINVGFRKPTAEQQESKQFDVRLYFSDGWGRLRGADTV